MKKLYSILLSIVLCIFLTSCSEYTLVRDGIDNFDVADSSMDLNLFILPSDDFLEKFKFEQGDYHYEDKLPTALHLLGIEKSIVVLQYSSDVYDEAKQFCLENIILSEKNCFEYNGYSFAENIELQTLRGNMENGINKKYPNWFNLFGFNDKTNSMVFIGFCVTNDKYKAVAEVAEEDIAKFLDENFSQFLN